MHKAIAASLFSLVSITNIYAQNGCTDPSAMNYNATARKNDGSCNYSPVHYEPALKTTLPKDLSESSGLVWDDGALWTHNDSGNPPELYKIDTATGKILQTVKIKNYDNIDWEDITADKKYIYIGDFGNNAGRRKDLKILRIAKKDIDDTHTAHVKAEAIEFNYADQYNRDDAKPYEHNFDCEALISVKDHLYIFTKDWGDKKTRVYKLPKQPGKYTVAPYDSFNVAGVVTGATYNEASKEIILLGYVSWMKYSFLWLLNGYDDDHFFTGNKRRIDMGDGSAWQTEGITFIAPNRFFISNEKEDGKPASLYISDGSILLQKNKQ